MDNQQTVEEAAKELVIKLGWGPDICAEEHDMIKCFKAGVEWQQSQSTNTGEGEDLSELQPNESFDEYVLRLKNSFKSQPPQQSGGDGKKDELIKIMDEIINKSEIEVERLNSEVSKLIGVLEELIFDYEHGSWSWSKTLKAKEAIKPYKQ